MNAEHFITPTQQRLLEQRRGRLKRLNPSSPPCPKPSLVRSVAVKKYHVVCKPPQVPVEIETQTTPIPISIRRIIAETCSETGFTFSELISPRRTRDLVAARNKGIWRAKRETIHSLARIGSAFNRDRTTVMHSIAQHEKRIASEASSGETQTNIAGCITKTAPIAHILNIGINNNHSS